MQEDKVEPTNDLEFTADHKQYPSKKTHIKKSLVWNTTQSIVSIHKQLAAGYSFDSDVMRAMVNSMIDFLNKVIKPKDKIDGN